MSNLTNNYRKYIAAAAAICLAMSAAGCSKSDSSSETDAKTASAQISSEAFEISAEDKDIGYDKTEAVKIALSGESAEIEGSGAACENGVLSITEGGTYILSGDLSGEIYVKAKDSEVKLVLNGVSVTNSDYAALMIDKASKVTLTLEDGTENSFADGAEYTLTDSNDNTDGCIFSRADLTINGSGSLSVTGSYKHGIVSKDNIVIAGGNITVNAASGGIYGKDSVKISGGTIDVTAGSNGIRATNDEDAEKGFVSVTGGDITVNAAGDALEAETVMQIEDGTLTLTSGGSAANASMKSDGQPNGDWGSWSKDDMGTPPDKNGRQTGTPPEMPSGSGDSTLTATAYTAVSADSSNTSSTDASSADSESTSAKGIKAGSELNILGGVISIDSSDDSLHSNGTVNISAGDITASSGDDGTHADGDLTISGGKITVSKSYEGLEGLNIYISGGEIDVTASDDGLNAAGGSDTGSDERAGRDMFADSDENYILGISGGTLKVNASGDGLDSNGNFVMSGGTVIVSGPTNGGNGALDIGDRDSTAQITGGTIVAAGAVGMAVGFSDNSTQYNVLHNFASTAAAGSEFTVTDADGEVLFTCTLDKECQSLVFSSADLASGTYTLTLGDQTEEVELSDICTSNSTSTGMGGRFGGGKRGQESPNGQGGMNDQNGQPPAKPEDQNNQNTANS